MCGRSQRGFHNIFELLQRDVEYRKGYNPFQISVSLLWPLNTFSKGIEMNVGLKWV